MGKHSGISGLIWGSALPILGTFGAMPQWLGIWSVCLAMMVYASLMNPSLPIVATAFIGATSLGGVVGWVMHSEYYLALATVALGTLMIFGVLRSAKAQILYEFASNVLQEKSETVSLLLREFEDSGADWLWQTDTGRCISHASPRFAFALEAEAKVVEGQPLLKLIAGDSWETGRYPDELHHLADKLKRREAFSNLIVPVTINGKRRWWELSASPRQADDGSFLGFRGVGSDVTEQRESAEKISHLARFDTLTSLPNRLQLTEALGQALSDADRWRRRCGFMMIDLDRFKAVNDTLGHPVGDRLLAQVAKRLKMIMSENELCGRLGGDEFAVVLKDASDANYVAQVSKRIIDTISKPYEVDQNTLYIGASIGSAVGPMDGRTVELLMRSADLALYRSKEEGGNTHHSYQHKLHANAEERRVLEFELRNALESNQFHLEYQPVVEANGDHGVVGFEALLRWNNPKFGNVSPAKFIPVAEDARLIVPIGNWVLRQACTDAMNWPSSIKVAVNVSVDQLTSPSFVETVVQALHDTGLPAWRLELEVTESIFVRDGGLAVQILDRLRKLGIKLSLDDFGTGYSSLGYLSNIRFDTIKVDRSFVTGASKGKAECIAIIRAVVAMADALDIATTAEGVENEAELAMIQQFGCDKIQGYYFGRPMVINDACALFSDIQRSSVA
ncbi:EAL domain-containing protein [Sphingorhabdus pulchriflava]|uniref:EAL domain-containing protein n=2 Tax=Sphingorhabdus pulchriflava TaxID=2292257 RepID=A0A371BKH0_9SPHN|nr:EAL domain-containing protein [Sphingorhabdus pulchriflava]